MFFLQGSFILVETNPHRLQCLQSVSNSQSKYFAENDQLCN